MATHDKCPWHIWTNAKIKSAKFADLEKAVVDLGALRATMGNFGRPKPHKNTYTTAQAADLDHKIVAINEELQRRP